MNTQTTSQALTSYRESGRLAAFKVRIEALLESAEQSGDELEVSNAITSSGEKEAARPLQKPCLRNLCSQLDFLDMQGSWKSCPRKCPFEHIALASLNKPSFDAALLKGDKIFGSAWSAGGWSDILESAFDTDDCGQL